MSEAIAVLSVKCGAAFLYAPALLAYCKQHEAVTRAILHTVYAHSEPLEPALIEALLLLSREIIRRFLLTDAEMVNVYMLVVLLRRHGISKLVELGWLAVTQEEVCAKLERADLQDDLIVALRLLTFLRFPESAREAVLECVGAVYERQMGPYEEYIKGLSLEGQKELSG